MSMPVIMGWVAVGLAMAAVFLTIQTVRMVLGERRAEAEAKTVDNEFSSMSDFELENKWKEFIQKQLDDLRHLALVAGMLLHKRGGPTREDRDQLYEAMARFRGEPELEPLRQAAINELKRRADEEGNEECAKILARLGTQSVVSA